ncbi:nucleotidyl transferase AbiEii/AbiGii toxin family protein [Sporichthya sp.]|uniref:nucleotidyl transferase AbiEii/AbiGii toxin family protein n=1 Tax=Sporichthya sp. TaxID=65475 RepID=UPI0018126ED0|nr:nucleotidyl transferase AbiEii/AbiGii toxin family protein [Sporichthya sp.]MBA3741344.1 nucleotidyl transferase AbiEii/AbiGii toxin family protein [Sporichthya sp.]
MSDEPVGSRLADLLRTLKPKDRQPVSAAVLNNWIFQAESKLGPEASGGRLGWLVASSVVIAALQRVVDVDDRQVFLLKGGTLLQHRLTSTARATKDVDGLVRADLDAFLVELERVLAEPWGPLTLRRGEVTVVNVPARTLKPRRFDIIIGLRGVTWRRIQIEVSPDEAGVGDEFESIQPPPLAGFGLPDPDVLVGIAMRFQIAQKLHAVSDLHDPPASVNDRPRDVVDLLLLRDLTQATGSPRLSEIRAAGAAVFEGRAQEAEHLGLTPRAWPPTVISHPHWANDYARAASSAAITIPLDDAVSQVNSWIGEIDQAF